MTTETVTQLTPEQKQGVIKQLQYIEKQGWMKINWDYDAKLTEKQISAILQGKAWEVESDILDYNMEYTCDIEDSALKTALEYAGIDYEEMGLELMDLRDEFIDYIFVDPNLKELISNSPAPNIRIGLYSNYDCINSHWFESQNGYFYKDSYFGDAVDALNLNPIKVKELLNSHGIMTHGTWPNKKNRDGKEYVSYDKFWQEECNRCSPANLLTILATLDIEDFLTADGKMPEIITVPKGNMVSFFSSMHGGGSLFDMPLLKDMKINLSKGPRRGDDYSRWGIRLEGSSSYSVKSVYGCGNDIFGYSITINKFKDKNESI